MYCFVYQDLSVNKTVKIPTHVALMFREGHIGNECNKKVHYLVGERVVSAVGKEKEQRVKGMGRRCLQY